MTTAAHTRAERAIIAGLLLSVLESNTLAGPDASPAEMLAAIPPNEVDNLGRDMIRLLRKTFR
jgi:hypothetical protein